MPKRPRQSHIPSQVRRRKPRRTADFSASVPESVDARAFADEAATTAPTGNTPVATRTRRRLEEVTRAREGVVSRTHHAGELPTFERAYLVRELTQIAITAGSLLALIVVLWVVMR